MSKATWSLAGEDIHHGLTEQFEKSWSMEKRELLISHFPSFFQEGREDGEDLKKKKYGNQNKTEKKAEMKTKASFMQN